MAAGLTYTDGLPGSEMAITNKKTTYFTSHCSLLANQSTKLPQTTAFIFTAVSILLKLTIYGPHNPDANFSSWTF